MLTKHAVGITTRWALEKSKNLEGSGEAAGQWWLEVSVGRAPEVGGCFKETVPRRLRRARGILGGSTAGTRGCEGGRKEVSGGKVKVRRAGKAVAHTEGHRTASGGDAEQNGSASRCAFHSDHIRSTRVGASGRGLERARRGDQGPERGEVWMREATRTW